MSALMLARLRKAVGVANEWCDRWAEDGKNPVPERCGDILSTHGKELIAAVEGTSVEAERLKAHIATIEDSDDGFNGPAWCGDCHAPMQVVRPGKHQCKWCEEREHFRAEAKRLKAALDQIPWPDFE